MTHSTECVTAVPQPEGDGRSQSATGLPVAEHKLAEQQKEEKDVFVLYEG